MLISPYNYNRRTEDKRTDQMKENKGKKTRNKRATRIAYLNPVMSTSSDYENGNRQQPINIYVGKHENEVLIKNKQGNEKEEQKNAEKV